LKSGPGKGTIMQFNRKLATRAAALALIGGAGAAALGAAGPAFADTPASSSGTATITVNTNISFAFDTSPSFSLVPGQNAPAAVKFTIATNAQHGFSLAMSAPDPSTGNASFPASDLSYQTNQVGGGELDQGRQTLSNTPVLTFNTTNPTGGFHVSQDWLATLAPTVAPGAYSTNILYVATTNP